MRIALALFALLLTAAPVMAQQPTTLDALAADVLAQRFPADPDAAPERIGIDAELAAALRAEPVDGGREKTLYMELVDGQLTPRASVLGARYRATGRCPDCDFPQPIRAHTHPYDNGLSVIDLLLSAQNMRPMLMAAHGGRLWLAVPTEATRALPEAALDDWPPVRFGVFGNRLQCPAVTPVDGWLGDDTMTRAVEAQARAAAAQMRLALYVSEPDQPFRRIETALSDEQVLSPHRRLVVEDLNAYERTLLGLIRAAGAGEAWGGPATPDAALDGALNQPWDDDEPNPAVVGLLRQIGNLTSRASARWFSALPTTVYDTPFGDPATASLNFTSVQYGPDCSEIWVLKGVQSFSPDGVRYTQGWRRARIHDGAAHEGWSSLAPDRFPTNHLVPW